LTFDQQLCSPQSHLTTRYSSSSAPSHTLQHATAVPQPPVTPYNTLQQFCSPQSHLTARYSSSSAPSHTLQHATIYFHIISLPSRFDEETFFVTKCVFWFSLQPFSETFFINKEYPARINQKYPPVFRSKTRFSCQIYAEHKFSWNFRKILKYQVSWNSINVYRLTDKHDEAYSHFSQFDTPNKEPFFVHL
jgi:hypothetical protein